MITTCGVLITDGDRYLICHPTGGKWWDIPKGQQDPGETHRQTAARELGEETGLVFDASLLEDLGIHDYKTKKRLALFKLKVVEMPDPALLACTSTFRLGKADIPEMDGYRIVDRDTCLDRVNPSMRRVLERLI
jgi:putative (di)nucleoside polyphosphate hydrolase